MSLKLHDDNLHGCILIHVLMALTTFQGHTYFVRSWLGLNNQTICLLLVLFVVKWGCEIGLLKTFLSLAVAASDPASCQHSAPAHRRRRLWSPVLTTPGSAFSSASWAMATRRATRWWLRVLIASRAKSRCKSPWRWMMVSCSHEISFTWHDTYIYITGQTSIQDNPRLS